MARRRAGSRRVTNVTKRQKTAEKEKTPDEAGGAAASPSWITPEMASQWLENHNKNNRPINQHRVDRYAEDMKSGAWMVTGDSIRFGEEGRLLDGQHRLWACVEAGVSFQTVVVTGLTGDSQLLMDQGMARTRGSQLAIMGHKRGASLASAAMNFWRMEGGRTRILLRAASPSNSVLFALIEDNPDIEECVGRYFSVKSQSGVRTMAGVSVASYTYMRRYDPEKADSFMESYLSGLGLEKGSPALALRERILQYRHKGWKILHDEFLTWLSYAWRAHVRGRTLNRISSKTRLPTFPGGPKWDSMEKKK